MIDSGSNKNYINPKHVSSSKNSKDFKILTVNGTFTVNKYVNFNPFPLLKQSKSFQFFVFNFHNFFDGLIGYEALQILKAIIDTANNKLIFADCSIPMKRKFPSKVSNLNNKVATQDFNNICLHYDKKINDLCECENFEFSNCSRSVDDVMKNVRYQHLNSQEYDCLKKVISKYTHCFYNEKDPLDFKCDIKHSIRTRDDIPVYTKSYRFPHCHRNEVEKQIQEMLQRNIIRPSISPFNSPIWVVPKKRTQLQENKNGGV